MSNQVRVDEVQLRVLINGSAAKKELAELSEGSVKLREKQDLLKKSLDDVAKKLKEARTAGDKEAVKQYTAEQARLTDELKKGADALAANRQRQEQLRKEIGVTGLSLKELRSQAAFLRQQLAVMFPDDPRALEMAAQLNTIEKRINEVNSAAGRNARVWEVMRQGMRLADMSMEQLEQEAARLRNALRTMNPNAADFRPLAAQLDAVEKRMATVRSGMSGWQRGFSDLKSGLLGFAGWAGAAVAGAYGLVRGIGGAISTIKEFDSALSNIEALGDEYEANSERIADSAIDLSVKYRRSATEVLSAVEALAKAGVGINDILGGGLEGTLTLAAAGNMELADAAELAALSMTQFHQGGKDIPHLADLLAAGSGKAAGSLADLNLAMKQSGLVASQMKVPVEENVGTLAAFASAGLIGSDAGTSFRTMLLRLSNPTKEAKDLMRQLNIETHDAKGNFVGVAGVAGQLRTNLVGLTDAKRQETLATIFGSDAIRAATVLYEQGEAGIRQWTAAVNDSGYAQEVAAKKLQNLAGAQAEFSSEWDAFILELDSGNGIISKAFTQFYGSGSQYIGALRRLNEENRTWAQTMRDVAAMLNGPVSVAMAEQIDKMEKNAARAKRAVLSVYEGGTQRKVTADEILGVSTAVIEETVQEYQLRMDQARANEKTKEAAEYERKLEFYKRILAQKQRADEALGKIAAAKSKGGGTETVTTPEQDAALKKAQAEMAKMQEELKLHRERMLQIGLDADERELRILDVKHQEERAKLKANKLATEQDLKNLEIAQASERADLIEQQGQKRIDAHAAVEKRIAEVIAQAKQDQIGEEAGIAQRQLEQLEQSGTVTYEALFQAYSTASALRDAQQIEAEQQTNAFYDQLNADAIDANVDTASIEEQRAAALLRIRRKYHQEAMDADQAFTKSSNALLQQDLNNYARIADGVASLTQAIANAYAAKTQRLEQLADQDGKRTEEENRQIEKAKERQINMTLTTLALQTAASIAKGVAGAMDMPFPYSLIAAAGVVAEVLALMSTAQSAMDSAPSSTPTGEKGLTIDQRGNVITASQGGGTLEGPSHAHGGLKVLDPKANRVVAEVEGGEGMLVMSKLFTRRNADLMPMLLEASKRGDRLNVFNTPGPNINTARVAESMRIVHMAKGGYVGNGVTFSAGTGAADPGGGPGGGVTFSAGTGARDNGGGGGNGEIIALLKRQNALIEQSITQPRPAELVTNSRYDEAQQRWERLKTSNKFRRAS